MAKKENVENGVSGGLSEGLNFGASRRALEDAGAAPRSEMGGAKRSLTRGYRASLDADVEERRSYRMNVLIKPSTAKALERAVNRGEIQSRNDLINYLLEQYFDEAGHR